eukprot:TRINITY_DN8809_c0_g1_i1.p1 TRINITY_DN8809_c0_g1~~TRINITY_DN8809_c0_g1_i1.p1  ORF type:complete len:651 (+),score=123.67 TRINITY_DN8809_c0_g1_i1:129-2081(+)
MDIPYRIRRKIVGGLGRIVDGLLISSQSLVTTWVQEVWRLAARFVTLIFAVLLRFYNKQALEQWIKENERVSRPTSTDEETQTDLLPSLMKFIGKGDKSSSHSDEDSDSQKNSGDEKDFLFNNSEKKRSGKMLYDVTSDPVQSHPVFAHEKVTTGFFEDLKLGSVLLIEKIFNLLNSKVFLLFNGLAEFRFRTFFTETIFDVSQWMRLWELIKAPFLIFRAPVKMKTVTKEFVQKQKERIDDRHRSDVLKGLGYPYARYDVITKDGYILTLERLPRPQSKQALYFQHGVMDSAFSWLAVTNTITGPAFRAFDLGYDVWAGTLRGCDREKRHVNPNISRRQFWDFTVNEHAFQDIPAFIEKIKEIKAQELNNPSQFESNEIKKETPKEEPGEPGKYTITIIAHSMGAMSTLMYLVYWRMRDLDHGISSAILLSPAGCHKTAPLLCRITGPLISLFLTCFPCFAVFKFPSDFLQVVIAKMMEDVKNNYSTRNFLSFLVYKLLGGSKDNHPFLRVPGYTMNIFAGCSAGIFKHFWQIWKSQKFQAYNYGKLKNHQIYGTTEPIDFFKNYSKIDIPVYFVMGLLDTLIEPVSILNHYSSLNEARPQLAYLKAFPKMGHIDFTVGENSRVTNFIFRTLKKLNQNEYAKTNSKKDV